MVYIMNWVKLLKNIVLTAFCVSITSCYKKDTWKTLSLYTDWNNCITKELWNNLACHYLSSTVANSTDSIFQLFTKGISWTNGIYLWVCPAPGMGITGVRELIWWDFTSIELSQHLNDFSWKKDTIVVFNSDDFWKSFHIWDMIVKANWIWYNPEFKPEKIRVIIEIPNQNWTSSIDYMDVEPWLTITDFKLAINNIRTLKDKTQISDDLINAFFNSTYSNYPNIQTITKKLSK